MRSLLLGDTVRDWENIHLPSVKMSAGFIFSQEMSTSAINYSLNPIKKAFWALHFGITKLGKTKRTIVPSRTQFEGQDWRSGRNIFKHIRQQRGKLFRQKEKLSMPIKKTEKPSCKFGHPPACQNYKSGTGCNFRRICFFQTCWGWGEAQQKVNKRWCERITCIVDGVHTLGLCNSRFFSEKVNSTWKREIGIKTRRQNTPNCTWHQLKKIGKERIHREELSQSVNLMSVILARQNSEKDHKKKPCNKNNVRTE